MIGLEHFFDFRNLFKTRNVGFLVFSQSSWIVPYWKRIFAKTRVGFGRTELSLSGIGTFVRALSFGYGPRGQGFEGEGESLDFHDFFGVSKMGKNMKTQDEHGQIWVSGALIGAK